MLTRFILPTLLVCAQTTFAAETIDPPAGSALAFQYSARGEQIYQCNLANDVYQWRLTGPRADLFDANAAKVGKHYAGPTWEADDGSLIRGKAIATEKAPDGVSVAWLLLSVAAHEGQGRMSDIAYVRRIDTKGGAAPQTPCAADKVGQTSASPYQANYLFYRAAK
jgi:Protein of unknown function (DUF3455)